MTKVYAEVIVQGVSISSVVVVFVVFAVAVVVAAVSKQYCHRHDNMYRYAIAIVVVVVVGVVAMLLSDDQKKKKKKKRQVVEEKKTAMDVYALVVCYMPVVRRCSHNGHDDADTGTVHRASPRGAGAHGAVNGDEWARCETGPGNEYHGDG